MGWFSNRGQVIQLIVAICGVAFSGVKAWPDIRDSKILSGGAITFYLLAALLCFVVMNIYWFASSYRPVTTEVDKDKSAKQPEIIKLETVRIEPTDTPKIVYKNKVRCVLTNVSNKTINVQRAAWITTKDGAGTQSPFTTKYQRESEKGSWQQYLEFPSAIPYLGLQDHVWS